MAPVAPALMQRLLEEARTPGLKPSLPSGTDGQVTELAAFFDHLQARCEMVNRSFESGYGKTAA